MYCTLNLLVDGYVFVSIPPLVKNVSASNRSNHQWIHLFDDESANDWLFNWRKMRRQPIAWMDEYVHVLNNEWLSFMFSHIFKLAENVSASNRTINTSIHRMINLSMIDRFIFSYYLDIINEHIYASNNESHASI